MDDYITIAGNAVVYVVRTSDWKVIAECESQTFANQIAAALNA